MGRQVKPIDMEKLLAMVDDQVPLKDMSQNLGISTPTLRNRIDALRQEQGIILEAKSVEGLRVTSLKDLVLTKLERNLPNMESDDLVKTLNVLNRMDTPPEDEEKNMKGLIGLLAKLDTVVKNKVEEQVEEQLLEEHTIDITKGFPKL